MIEKNSLWQTSTKKFLKHNYYNSTSEQIKAKSFTT